MFRLSQQSISYCQYGFIASLLPGLIACTTAMPAQPSQASTSPEKMEQVFAEYRSSQVEVLVVRQQFLWQFPDADQHLAQFAHHITVDGTVPVRLQEFVISYHNPRLLLPASSALAGNASAMMQVSRNGEFLLREVISPVFTGEQRYRLLEVAKLKVGTEAYVLTVANRSLRQPMWLAIFGMDGHAVYRIGLPHGTWQFTEHADGISMVDTSGSGRRLVIRPAQQ
ncbi:hypothetical protein ACO0K9_19035 [Undibacterium sp. Ji50W]|uniref:hypothetical protein n=1 Tax=Undibacterium sp. Ji50W TaxID=3413041 RepID=UPI003BF1A34B